MTSEAPLTYNQAIRGVAEFIEVAIHTILYVRQVYPADLFIRRKKYNTPVYQSRHPVLNEYIAGATRAVADELAAGTVDKVVVVIKTKDDVPLERFIFSIRNMIQVEAYNKDTSVEDAMTPSDLGQYLRAFLVKLCVIESQLGHLSEEEVTFAVVVEMHDDEAPAVSRAKDPPPWVPAAVQHTTTGVLDSAELHMLRSVETGIINLSFAVQESEQKILRRTKNAKGKERAP